ncbi:hypothetical protein [Gallibacterium anatis]|uniref:Uncharacterized protein n=1 Tax=Gallibacterium anatis (strain UMN179) TaxID=1005058 RepID=F4HC75_GALAU|nr:hypothetical protein [Gallibacterium anatis]AEC17636.1 hypothetical protein UMN179_01619 [Gallibacterium anatis UMN179]
MDKQIDLLEQLLTAEILNLAKTYRLAYDLKNGFNRTTDDYIRQAVCDVVRKRSAILQLLLEEVNDQAQNTERS